MPVPAHDICLVTKPAYVRRVVEVGDTADAVGARVPVRNHVEITLDVLQNLEAYDRII